MFSNILAAFYKRLFQLKKFRPGLTQIFNKATFRLEGNWEGMRWVLRGVVSDLHGVAGLSCYSPIILLL